MGRNAQIDLLGAWEAGVDSEQGVTSLSDMCEFLR